MKKLKNITAAKKLTALAITIAIVFASINLFWIVTQWLPYYGYAGMVEKKIDEYTNEVRYSKKIGQYGYRVSKPNYLGYNGSLSVGKSYGVYYDENGKAVGDIGLSVILFIWPQWADNCEYGIFVNDFSRSISLRIHIDENINHLPGNPDNTEYNERIKGLIEENYDTIKEQMEGARALWGLNGTGDIWTGLKAFINDITLKHVLTVFAAAAALFAIINLFWLIFALLHFRNYTKKLEKFFNENEAKVYQKTVNGFLYEAQRPKYLRYGCLLSVSNDNAGLNLTLHIYSGLKRSKQYTVFVGKEQNGAPERVPITRDIEYDKTRGARMAAEKTVSESRGEELIDKYFTEIKPMIYGARNLWEFVL
ncbi:MAG: hypothetical protein ACOX45_01955 [Acutalibacteraceae bacterium]